MKTVKTYNLGPVSFTVTEGEEKAEVRLGRKTEAVPLTDLLAFATAILGPSKAILEASGMGCVPPTPAQAKPSDMDNRKAVSNSPMKRMTMEDFKRIEKPVVPPAGVFLGLSSMAEPINPLTGGDTTAIQFAPPGAK